MDSATKSLLETLDCKIAETRLEHERLRRDAGLLHTVEGDMLALVRTRELLLRAGEPLQDDLDAYKREREREEE